ncbi:hypothetical protein [Nocardioides sp. SYSU DS0651]|uniref:hypothetical protein n=1 Tax=Nocardioides sp. SYSU DS0651 TaxID=3415955 RepID=UPI003F4B8336
MTEQTERPTGQAEQPDASGRIDPNEDTGQKLPPPPEPTAEPQAPPPGGPHAVPGVGGEGAYSTAARDLDPDRNPATDHELPQEAKEPEDTDTEATKGGDGVDPADESPA